VSGVSCYPASSLIYYTSTKAENGEKYFSNDPELRKLSFKCKTAWKKWRKAGSPWEGPEFEEKTRLHHLTKQCANKCPANLECKFWKSREGILRPKTPGASECLLTNPCLVTRLLHKGELTSDPAKI